MPVPGVLGGWLRCAVGPRRVGHTVPARRLQVREGSVAVPGSAPPGSAPPPRPVPGTSRAVLNQKLPWQKHVRADPRRDGAGSASQPWRIPPRGLFPSRRGQQLSAHGMRRGSSAAVMLQHSKARQERTLPLVPLGPGWGAAPLAACPLPPLPASQQIPSCCSKIKPESPKLRFPACPDSAEPSDHPSPFTSPTGFLLKYSAKMTLER